LTPSLRQAYTPELVSSLDDVFAVVSNALFDRSRKIPVTTAATRRKVRAIAGAGRLAVAGGLAVAALSGRVGGASPLGASPARCGSIND
jgi:hypothetical protein